MTSRKGIDIMLDDSTIALVKHKQIGNYYTFVAMRSQKPFKNKMQTEMLLSLNEDDIVVDIGAYVGEYSLFAHRQNVKNVISYEATPNTFEVLKRNVEGKKIEIHNMAVVSTDNTHVDLNISKGIGVTNSVIKQKMNGIVLRVPAINYDKVVETATVVKIDVEGCEYTYDLFKKHIRGYIIEFHSVDKDWKEKAERIMSTLETNGYKCLHRPTFSHGFDMHGTWVRA
jgi:FkbM family methyltransferase